MNTIIFILLGFLMIIATLVILFAIFTSLSLFKTGGALFATTHHSKIKKILETVPMHPGQVVYDLGCGDGRFLAASVKRYKVNAIGLEINPWPYMLARLRAGLGKGKMNIRFQDFWKADLNKADIVFCYLFPDVMERLREKLTSELKSGTKVISCNFQIPGWKPEKIITASHSKHNEPIFLYTKSP